jgi:parvulin-like peptidyl-prolyl isomerase
MTKTHVAFCLTSAALLSSSISGCTGSWTQSEISQPLLVEDMTETGSTSARPALLIENSALSRDALWPVLAEIAGTEAIRETVLDHAVSVELQRAGLVLTDADVEAERQRLSDRLMPNGTEEESAEIMRRVLEGRGLGPVRLGALLRRNAGMRKLIADEAVPSIDMIELAFKVRFGPQLHTRMISTATPHAAQQALQSIRSRANESGLLIAFMEIAVERSTDQSSSLGGNLGPISPDDPGLPVAIRSVLADLEPMQLSSIVALDTGYAILLVESSTPAASITLEEVFENLEQEVRDRQERLLMDRLGQSLLNDYSPSVLDASLRWSWER